MSYQPHLHKGGELYHARTFGSKNGISNTPGYRAKGRKAVGRFVGVDAQGHPIYDYSQRNPAPNQRYQQQQRINAAVATNAGAKGQSARELRERQANANIAKARRQEAQQYRINKAVATNAGAKGQSARELRERHANADIANARRQDIANYNSFGSRAKMVGENIGNWLNERGREASGLAGRAGRFISKIAGRARTAIGNAWDGKAGAGTGLDLRNERLTKSVGARTKSGAAALRKGADDAKRAYDNSIVGRFNAARDWMGRRAKDVSDAAGRARTAIGNAWDGSAGRGSAKDKANAATSNAEAYKTYARRNAKAGNSEMGSKYAKLSREASGEAYRQQKAYDQSIKGRIERAGKDISKWAGKRSKDAANAYNRASEAVTTAAGNASSTITTKANQVKTAAEQKVNATKAEYNLNKATKKLDKIDQRLNNVNPDSKEGLDLMAERDRIYREEYRPARTAYDNTHKKK